MGTSMISSQSQPIVQSTSTIRSKTENHTRPGHGAQEENPSSDGSTSKIKTGREKPVKGIKEKVHYPHQLKTSRYQTAIRRKWPKGKLDAQTFSYIWRVIFENQFFPQLHTSFWEQLPRAALSRRIRKYGVRRWCYSEYRSQDKNRTPRKSNESNERNIEMGFDDENRAFGDKMPITEDVGKIEGSVAHSWAKRS